MRFVTEMDLRVLYSKEPFKKYKTEKNTRITPGARQFLLDRRIVIEENHKIQSERKASTKVYMKNKVGWRNKKLIGKIRTIESLFYRIGQKYLDGDILLAEEIINWGNQLHKIRKGFTEGYLVEGIKLNECTGINSESFYDSLEECFHITDFHLRLDRGMDIITLHELRCKILEIEPIVMEITEHEDEDILLLLGLVERINEIVNSLSQRICSLVGGEKCLRKT